MGNKALALRYIDEKLKKQCFLNYDEIAEITGYHPKYILKLKKDFLSGNAHV